MGHARVVVLIIGLSLAGVAIGVITAGIGAGGLSPRSVYLTGVVLLISSGVLCAVAPIYQQLTAVRRELATHKRHDREALAQAAHLTDTTGPQPVTRIRR